MNKTTSELVQSLIVKIRKEHSLSQHQLSEILFVSERTVRNWEKGKSIPSLDDLRIICKVFNISFDQFFLDDFNECSAVSQNPDNDYSQPADYGLLKWFITVILLVFTGILNFIYYSYGRVSLILVSICALAFLTSYSYVLFRNNKNTGVMIANIVLTFASIMYILLVFVSEHDINSYLSTNIAFNMLCGAWPGVVFALTESKQLFFILGSSVYLIWNIASLFRLFETIIVNKTNINVLKTISLIITLLFVIIPLKTEGSIDYISSAHIDYNHYSVPIGFEGVNIDNSENAKSLYNYFASVKKHALSNYEDSPDNMDGTGFCIITFYSGNTSIAQYIITFNDYRFIKSDESNNWMELPKSEFDYISNLLESFCPYNL